MFDQITDTVNKISNVHLNALFLLGLILFVGIMGARLFQRLRIPQVVGYIIAGILLGRSGLNIIDKDIIEVLVPFNYFALGLIGFMIGGELKNEVFRRYGKQFLVILLSEGVVAFLAVFILVGALGSLLFGNSVNYWALGLLLGAIASATAPAATTDVLWEYKTRGPLTTTVLGIVALDDGLALILFAIASSIAPVMLGAHSSVFFAISRPIYEIGMGIMIGLIFSVALIKILRKYAERDKILVFSVCSILFALGSALIMKVDMLLAVMTMGAVLINREVRLSKEIFKLISSFATPFYVLFFVLVGAKFDLHVTTASAIIIAVFYLVGRTSGKMAGAYLGAKGSGAPKTVIRYLPYCLFSQAGVAIGLSILASQVFPGPIGNSIIVIVTLTTFVVQLLGPPCVKYAVTKAQEVGLNITEEDVLRKTNVSHIIDKNPPYVYENMPLKDILNIFSQSNYHTYPVVDKEKKLKGVITIESIRRSFAHSEMGNLVIAHDIMESVITRKISPASSLLEAEEIINKYNVDYLPIVNIDSVLLGFMEKEAIDKFVSSRLIEAEEKVASMG
ncbi:MAG: cation:proton antiporter [Candidatus Omnitrophica bacterium]|jgi:Kef-type K+ transport system membrane component KefB/predicted transcriptional regulator|nr:cation:proton antiporter [Candidatus Omnitrophota bacterium]MDD5691445.1 cation:proton antiporter [Candidatus Omnitrophota bacterium]